MRSPSNPYRSSSRCGALALTLFLPILTLLGGSCNGDIHTLVLVTVKNKPVGISTFTVLSGLGNAVEKESHSFPATADQFGLRLPAQSTGKFDVTVWADSGPCTAARGQGSTVVSGEPKVDLEIDLGDPYLFQICPTQPKDFSSVWGSDSSDVWMVGSSGLVVHWDGVQFNDVSPQTSVGLNGVWGLDSGNVWAVGRASTLLNHRPSGWTNYQAKLPAGVDLVAIHGTAMSNIWVVGSETVGTNTNAVILKIDATDPNNLSVSRSQLAKPFAGKLWSVFSRRNQAWAVGERGTILSWDGMQWVAVNAGQDAMSTLFSIWGSVDGQDLLAAGDNGKPFSFDGNKWGYPPASNMLPTDSGNAIPIFTIWGISPTWNFLGGPGGNILVMNDGKRWQKLNTPTIDSTFNALGVWGVVKGGRLKHLWVAGSQKKGDMDVGGVYHYVDDQ